ncbi:MAG: aminotransferase class V-fold PLP-dependent enzyme [Oscillospiraceae bacterium]|nr:aminotransferase class V-fold PLP-dependent enzyme [Oscillospiraceae bacterium]
MESREEIRARLRAASDNLTRYATAYRALEHRDFDTVYPLVMGYIRDRFLLTKEMCRSDRLLDLADVSLRYMLELKRMGIDPGEISRSCSGASSVITKKVLLMKAVQEVFDVTMTPEEFANLTTVTELTNFICAQASRRRETQRVSASPKQEQSFDVDAVRADFPALGEQIHGHPLVYLDNAATAQVPKAVLEAVAEIEGCRGNVHRGIHSLGSRCTEAYEQARRVCAEFLGAEPGQITFTSGTTDGINRVAMAFSRQKGGIVTTVLEHHSNFVPWQQLCRSQGRPFRVCPMVPDGGLDLAALDKLLTGDIGLLAVTHCSNVLGTVTPIREIVSLAHSRGIRVLVDGAQSVCHRDIDLQALDCDYFVCSGHKLSGPFGVGLLYCKEPLPPMIFGGGMVDVVTENETTFLPTLEAGTPNVSGAVGLAAAIIYRQNLPEGWQAHEAALLRRTETLLEEIPGVRIFGSSPREGCVAFTVEGLEPFDAVALLDQLGIALRSGNHCAQPLHLALGMPYTVRVSPAFYNTFEEIDALAQGLRRIIGS